jgi:prepilin-type N-terminal cleavage/methylation domain-containing protein
MFTRYIMNPTMCKRSRAFTLVELLVVIGIIGLLISILLPALSKARNQATLVSCAAQLRNFGNAIQLYAQDNRGTFPGPALAQIRVGYFRDSFYLTDYLHRYLKLPDCSNVNGKPGYDLNTPVLSRSLLCPGYAAANSGAFQTGREWTYSGGGYDPFPWFGYPTQGIFPIREKIAGTIRVTEIVSGKTSQMVAPMKLSQMFQGSQFPIIGETDRNEVVFEGFTGTQIPPEVSGSPPHGGKGETRQGVQEINVPYPGFAPGNGNGPFYQIVDKSAFTNPPRNWLFGDWHVATYRKSGPVLMRDKTRFGDYPTGVTLLSDE